MDPELLYTALNAAPMPIWLCWIAAPRSRASRYFARVYWPWALLAAAYVATLGTGLVIGGPDDGGMGSLGGVMASFQAPWIALGAWVHYLCFDLFVARWMVNDSPDAGYKLSPILALTLFAGPAGLLLYLAARNRLTST